MCCIYIVCLIARRPAAKGHGAHSLYELTAGPKNLEMVFR